MGAAMRGMFNKGNGLSGYQVADQASERAFTFSLFFLKLCAACSLIHQLLDVCRGFLTMKTLTKNLPALFKKLKYRGETDLPYKGALVSFMDTGKVPKDQRELLVQFFSVLPYVLQEGLRVSILKQGSFVAGISPLSFEIIIDRCTTANYWTLDQKREMISKIPDMGRGTVLTNGRLTEAAMTAAGIPEGPLPEESAELTALMQLEASEAAAADSMVKKKKSRDELCDVRQRCLIVNSSEFDRSKRQAADSKAVIVAATEAKKTAEAAEKRAEKEAIKALKANQAREVREVKSAEKRAANAQRKAVNDLVKQQAKDAATAKKQEEKPAKDQERKLKQQQTAAVKRAATAEAKKRTRDAEQEALESAGPGSGGKKRRGSPTQPASVAASAPATGSGKRASSKSAPGGKPPKKGRGC